MLEIQRTLMLAKLGVKENQNSDSFDAISNAMTVLREYKFPTPSSERLSPKINLLLEILVKLFSTRGTNTDGKPQKDHRVIVFVEQRSTAMILARIIRMWPQLEATNAQALVGHAGASDGMNIAHQMHIVRDFRNGASTVLVATNVAEEGIDIPACNVIIRFDICKSLVSFLQSKGRARAKAAVFLTLRERDNPNDTKKMEALRRSEVLLFKYLAEAQSFTRLPRDLGADELNADAEASSDDDDDEEDDENEGDPLTESRVLKR